MEERVWHVDVEVATKAPVPSATAIERFDELVHGGLDGTISGEAGQRHYGAAFPWRADEAAITVGEDAVAELERLAAQAGIPKGQVVRLVVMTDEVMAAEQERSNFPVVVGAGEVMEILGVSKQRLAELRTTHATFPKPFVDLKAGPIWTELQIRTFLEGWSRKPGRPKKQEPEGEVVSVRDVDPSRPPSATFTPR